MFTLVIVVKAMVIGYLTGNRSPTCTLGLLSFRHFPRTRPPGKPVSTPLGSPLSRESPILSCTHALYLDRRAPSRHPCTMSPGLTLCSSATTSGLAAGAQRARQRSPFRLVYYQVFLPSACHHLQLPAGPPNVICTGSSCCWSAFHLPQVTYR